jgi:hypothetical protein
LALERISAFSFGSDLIDSWSRIVIIDIAVGSLEFARPEAQLEL